MRLAFFIAVAASLLLLSCERKPSIQKYFVDHSEQKDFVTLDISPSIINVDKAKLTADQKKALASFDKMNILIFKSDSTNMGPYNAESEKVSQILKQKEYQQLMKVGSGKDAASISFVGDEDAIDEFILFAKKKENGFTVIRILGNDMNPNNIMNMLSVIQQADIDSTQLASLKNLMK